MRRTSCFESKLLACVRVRVCECVCVCVRERLPGESMCVCNPEFVSVHGRMPVREQVRVRVCIHLAD